MKRRADAFLAGAALLALVWFGWSLSRPAASGNARLTEAVLWTDGAVPGATVPSAAAHYAVEGTAAPATSRRIPDLAFLRRSQPELRRLEVRGDGLEPAELAATRGLELVWRRPETKPIRPVLRALSVPRTLARGERLEVRGTWAGLKPGEPVPVAVEGPDGAVATVTVTATGDGTADFTLRSTPAPASGRFEWNLRAGTGGEAVNLGVSVREGARPQVLLLPGSPAPEFARLQRWLADEGTPVTAHTRVSADRYRTVAANGGPEDLPQLDAESWARFDAVVATETALAGLAEPERTALATAVGRDGVGLLVVGDPDPGRRESDLLPWTVPAAPADSGLRLARLRLLPDTDLPEPVAIGETALPAVAAARPLVADTRGRTLAAVRPRGRGKLVRSVMFDTWRWPLAGQDEIYGAVWRGILAAAARPAASARGSWDVPGEAPVFVGEPVRLRWRGPAAACPREATVTGGAAPDPMVLPTTASADRREAAAMFWPERAGWHRFGGSAADDGIDVWVHPATALAEWRAERRREALAARVGENPVPGESAAGTVPARPWWPAAVFLGLAGWVWFRERKG